MPDALASQVAAGEVVERPASVVKELVENSLDAGAREIVVEMQRGGVALLKVSDDGRGMNREDALLCLERHATSKLRSKEDLPTIGTLGFRGEAIPSIASVSRFRLTTREAEAVSGTEITVDGGVLREARDAGCPPGTTVEVRDLFFNVPARRKFLKSESTEAAHVDHQVRLHALASVETRVVFRKDARAVLDLPGTPDRRVRIGDLFGRGLLGKLVEVPRAERPGVAISGFLLPASEARSSRRGQHVILNGRPVDDGVVWRAIAEGFRGALPPGRHPVAWLWLEMDPLLVDVNVHPAKREVRFHKPADLRALVVDAIDAALRD
ncbi:MAG: DNA mismatch repair endonuclease MutL, partial [Akkermansiaceae bacterium]|nr:DNA mismatch repair endonuclease MutL [Akkermansiaceae bacterium]